jgi:peptidoglycan/xylan/chitin deacetylase (PgdA/CDA1 family)
LGLYLRKAGLEYISWSIRSGDTRGLKPEALSRRVLDNVASGDIILFHDYLRAGAGILLDTLPGIIDELRNRGFEFVTVGPVPVEAEMVAGAR